MPHIVFDKKIDLMNFSKKFVPIFQKEPFLVRVSTIFVDKDNLTALLPAVAISKIHQQYLIEISTRKSKTTIRLYPSTDPEKTEEVKISMALVGKQIMQNYNDCKIIKTNIPQANEIIL
ncbi:MAG: hypothetical protein OEM21_02760 [Nitrosopumilus sp.]|nr:hypothetical protein [Nitrosopumilus sp.]